MPFDCWHAAEHLSLPCSKAPYYGDHIEHAKRHKCSSGFAQRTRKTRCGDTIAASTVLTSLAPWSDKFNIYTMYNTIVSIYNRNQGANQAQTCDAVFVYIAN